MSVSGRAVQWLGVSALTYPLGLLYSIILARGLGPEARGEYAALLTIATALAGLLSMALGVVGRAEIARDVSTFRWVHSNLIWFCAIAGGIVAVIVPTGVRQASQMFGIRSPALAAAAVLSVPLLIYGIYWPLVFQGAGHFNAINALRLGRALFEPTLLLVLFLVVGKILWSAVGTWLVASLLAVIVGIWLSMRWYGPLVLPDWPLLKGHLQHGWKLALSAQAIALQTQAAVLMLAYHSPRPEVAFFAIANGAAAQIGALLGTVAVVSSDRLAGGDHERAGSIVMLLNRLFVGGTVCAALLLALAGVPLVSVLYGTEFRRAGTLLWLLAAAVVASQTSEVNSQYLIGQHRDTGVILKVCLVNAVLGVGLCGLLIPRHGALGAAVGIGVAYVVNAVAYQIVVRSRLRCTWRAMAIVTGEDIAGVVQAIRQLWPGDAVAKDTRR